MDRLTKLLRKLSAKDKAAVLALLKKVKAKDPSLEVKKLKGFKYLYRARARNYRVVYFDDGDEVLLKRVEKRDERTYKNL